MGRKESLEEEPLVFENDEGQKSAKLHSPVGNASQSTNSERLSSQSQRPPAEEFEIDESGVTSGASEGYRSRICHLFKKKIVNVELSVYIFFFLLTVGAVAEGVVILQISQSWICSYYTGLQGVTETSPECRSTEIQKTLAYYQGTVNAWMIGIVAMIATKYLVNISDRYGRKPIILFSSVGMIIADSLTVMTYQRSIFWLVGISLLNSVMGGATTVYVALSGYFIDLCGSENRTQAFSYIQSCALAGALVGAAGGTYIVKAFDGNNLAVYWISIPMKLMFAIYVPSMKESLSYETRLQTIHEYEMETRGKSRWYKVWHDLNPLKSVMLLFQLPRKDIENSRFNFLMIELIEKVGIFAVAGLSVPTTLLSNLRFSWSSVDQGYLQVQILIVDFIMAGVVIPQTANFWKRRKLDPRHDNQLSYGIMLVLRIGSLAMVGASLAYGFASSETMFILNKVLQSAFHVPMTVSLNVAMVFFIPSGKYGNILATDSVLGTIAATLGSSIADFGYAYFVDKNVGMYFIMPAFMFLVSFGLSMMLK